MPSVVRPVRIYNQRFGMAVITLQEKLTAAGARFASYRGSETAASFGDTAGEFRALLEGTAVFDLSWQAKLVLSGEDRVRWLNGMVTNNIRDLALNHGNYSFVLNPQGRNLGDLVAYNRGDYLLVTAEYDLAPRLKQVFDQYIIMDDVEVEDISDKLASIGVAGRNAAETLRSAGIDVSQLAPGEVSDPIRQGVGLSIARSVLPHMDGYEIWSTAENLNRLWDALVAAGAKPAGSDALELYHIARGVPRYGIDLREKDLPQETGQQHVLNFAKGCYVGQEIVERIRSRGNVHRMFVGLEVQGDAPAAGDKIFAGDKDVGEITSAARVAFPAGEKTLALGYIRRECAEPGTEVKIGEQTAVVSVLPFE
jgi:folate-binding protein YgfZ